MTGADLQSANLTEAMLDEADVSRAIFGGSLLNDVDLGSVRNLVESRHSDPSEISISTLLLTSRGVVGDPRRQADVETFLKLCGLEGRSILLFRQYVGSHSGFRTCFISHSHEDGDFAKRLLNELEMRGVTCWIDIKNMVPGDDIYDGIRRGVERYDKVILCCSRTSLTSWWVDHEIEEAFCKERRLTREGGRRQVVLIPLDLDGYLFQGWTGGKATQVQSRIAGHFRGWNESPAVFEKGLVRLLEALRLPW